MSAGRGSKRLAQAPAVPRATGSQSNTAGPVWFVTRAGRGLRALRRSKFYKALISTDFTFLALAMSALSALIGVHASRSASAR